MPAVQADPRAGTILVRDQTTDDGTFELRILYPNHLFAVRQALAAVMDGLSGIGLGPDGLATTELVLAEVLNNVAEHAYADDPFGLVELHVRRLPDRLRCRVIDAGKPMPGGLVPAGEPLPVPGPVDALPEGGFGWFLIHTLATNLVYARRGGRNDLSFEIAYDRPRSS